MSEQIYYGLVGRILRVNLTDKTCNYEPIEPYLEFIGGRGISDWILFNEVEPQVEALSAENKVIFGTGLLTGTMFPSSSRLNISCKSVSTGGISTSNVGGHFAAELKYAGVDQLIIEGKSEEPVYLYINDSQVEIRNAQEIWGMTTWETDDYLKTSLNDPEIKVASIGPAGENLVKFACIMVGRSNAAGWGGSGAVLGYKNLKAIAVRGTGAVNVFDPQSFWQINEEFWARLKKSPAIRRLQQYGTQGAYGVGGPEGKQPQGVRNQTDEFWDYEKGMNVREMVFRERWETGKATCFNCPIACNHFYHMKNSKYGEVASEGIHTNTVRAFGSNLDITEPEAILKAQALSNQYGMHVDSTSGVIAWAFEAYERGILTKNETSLDLNWGNAETMVELITKIAYREEIGDLLAEGVLRAAEKVGQDSKEFAIHAKGSEINEQGIRSHKCWALGIFTSTRGGGHLNGAALVERLGIPRSRAKELFGTETISDPTSYEGKGKATAWYERFKSLVDMMGVCYYTSFWIDLDMIGPEDFAKIYTSTTGKAMSVEQLLRVGEKIQNIEKAFNTLHMGFGRADDFPSQRYMEIPVSKGPFAGQVIQKEGYDLMLSEYYRDHNWDPVTGWQTKQCLEDLGLPEILQKLEQSGRI